MSPNEINGNNKMFWDINWSNHIWGWVIAVVSLPVILGLLIIVSHLNESDPPISSNEEMLLQFKREPNVVLPIIRHDVD
jgi:hypothetical protein